MKNLNAIRQYNNYFKEINESRYTPLTGLDGEKLAHNHVAGWSFMKASQMT